MARPVPGPARSHARLVLVAWLCGLSAVLYLDRICMSQAVVPIQAELGLSNTEIGYVMMAFTLAYGLFEVPAGRLGDRFGSRWVLTRIVVWWSVFTALTGAAGGFLSLVVVRFLFGAGEAGAFPNVARVLARWFPPGERGRVQGLVLAAAQFGAVLAPVGAAVLIESVGWRWAFVAFGAVGVVWAVGFGLWFRDDPARHPGVNAAELSHIRGPSPPAPTDPGPVPWRAVLSNRGVLVLSGIMVFGAFYTYFFYSWFPKYLSAARGVDNVTAGTLASLVMAGSAVGMLLGGWLADRIPVWSGDPVRARRYLGTACYALAAVGLFGGIGADDPRLLAVLWGSSFCTMHITLPNWWMLAIPQAGRHVGALCGLMNGCGVLGALASQWFVGWYSDHRADRGFTGRDAWDPLLDVYVGVLLLNAVLWWAYRPVPLGQVRPSEACPSPSSAGWPR
jgi:ACS family glucarate transporter-like MFS transporter